MSAVSSLPGVASAGPAGAARRLATLPRLSVVPPRQQHPRTPPGPARGLPGRLIQPLLGVPLGRRAPVRYPWGHRC
eukprot:15479241-Alexandrium_andersonii.AAC.1